MHKIHALNKLYKRRYELTVKLGQAKSAEERSIYESAQTAILYAIGVVEQIDAV